MSMLKEMRKDDQPGYSWYLCICGSEKRIRRNAVSSGSTKSCGCHRKKTAVENGKAVTTHGLSQTPAYRFWSDSKARGHLKEEWHDFETFYTEVGKEYKSGMNILDGKLVDSSTSKRERTKETSIKKYGVEHPSQSEVVKNKAKQTNVERYGVESPSKLEAVKEKSIKTCLKKYGVPHHTMTQEYKDRTSQRASSKFNGKTSKEWAKELQISRSYFNILVREFGIEHALSHEKTVSSIELAVRNILLELGVVFETQFKVKNRIADFFIPEHDLIIEADGHYWHSDAVNDDKMYHFKKRQLYVDSGFSPLFFREGEIVNKTNIVRSIISNRIGRSEKIFARKCSLVSLDRKTRKHFFEENHLMGGGSGKAFALESGGKVVAAMQYTNKSGCVDISRFCSAVNTQVVGGFSKLLAAIEASERPSKVTNFVDLRYGSGSHLKRFGFNLERCSVSFSWVNDLDCFHRMRFPGNSGYENGYARIYDCGQAKFVKQNTPRF
jgi:very-short-patch-repair endonuclease